LYLNPSILFVCHSWDDTCVPLCPALFLLLTFAGLEP
jgi:hypothetical protein